MPARQGDTGPHRLTQGDAYFRGAGGGRATTTPPGGDIDHAPSDRLPRQRSPAYGGEASQHETDNLRGTLEHGSERLLQALPDDQQASTAARRAAAAYGGSAVGIDPTGTTTPVSSSSFPSLGEEGARDAAAAGAPVVGAAAARAIAVGQGGHPPRWMISVGRRPEARARSRTPSPRSTSPSCPTPFEDAVAGAGPSSSLEARAHDGGDGRVTAEDMARRGRQGAGRAGGGGNGTGTGDAADIMAESEAAAFPLAMGEHNDPTASPMAPGRERQSHLSTPANQQAPFTICLPGRGARQHEVEGGAGEIDGAFPEGAKRGAKRPRVWRDSDGAAPLAGPAGSSALTPAAQMMPLGPGIEKAPGGAGKNGVGAAVANAAEPSVMGDMVARGEIPAPRGRESHDGGGEDGGN